MKPLFIPLKRQYFEAFSAGKKKIEYRKLGPRWNFNTCIAGRSVTLSLGYSGARMSAHIHRLEVIDSSSQRDAMALYGPGVPILAIHLVF